MVVAVIGVLASLLLPALSKAKEKGRQAFCMGNLRQLGIAARMYWDDNEGRAFRYRGYATNNGDVYWFGWIERGSEGKRGFDRSAGAMYPYLSGRGVELCPSLNYGMAKFKLKATGAAYGYGYNVHLSRMAPEPRFDMDQIRAPALCGLFGDAAQVNAFQPPASPANPMLEEFYYISAKEPTTHFRHGRRAEVVFADGHVEGLGMKRGSMDARLPREMVGMLDEGVLMP